MKTLPLYVTLYMTFLQKPKYHIYALTGFLVYILCTLTVNKIYFRLSGIHPGDGVPINTAITYYIAEAAFCAFLAYLLSLPLLWVIEKNSDFSRFRGAMGARVLAVFVVVQVAYTLMLWPVLSTFYQLIIGKPIKIEKFMRILNMTYFAGMYLIWMFTVVTVKLVQYLKQEKIKQLQLENNLRDSQLNTLKGQINPHFMFNSLNNIRGLILEDTGRAREMITRLSEMLRYSLTKNGVNTIPLKDELQTVENYIEISRIQFEGRLHFTMEAAHDTLNIPIPPMVVQMLIENAVKHGIGKLPEGGLVRLVTTITPDNFLHIGVLNSGRLELEKGGTRLGLENIKKRLFLIFGDKAKFTLKEKEGFVEACIILPLA